MMRCTYAIGAVLGLLFGFALARAAESSKYPPPPSIKDPSALGVGIQRTMKLLQTSSPQHRNHVRILFYGQSITEQDWWKRVGDDLRQRFPDADLEIENRAIGGFASQLLIRPAEHDVYPFYPDLVIFHVYGANQQYEQIIRTIRTRTTAEVLMQKDHVTAWPADKPDPNQDKGLWWDHMMNNVFLPDIAKKYGCALIDIHGDWLTYLRDNNLQPKDLLKDGVHLNDQGCYLMAELVKRYLTLRLDLDPDRQRTVTTLQVGKDIRPGDGKLKLEFEGNRVDAIAAQGDVAKPAIVLVDGKRPSEFADAYCITRPSPGPWSPLFLSRVDHDKPLVVEDWTLKVTQVSDDGKSWKFDVRGSLTGDDGSGESGALFTSKSSRVKIDPAAWFRGFNPKLPAGYEIKWRVLPIFVDAYQAPKVTDPSRECVTTLVQGIANEKHTLEIIGAAPIQAIRIHRPPVK